MFDNTQSDADRDVKQMESMSYMGGVHNNHGLTAFQMPAEH